MPSRISGSTRPVRAISLLAFAAWGLLPASPRAATEAPVECTITSTATASTALRFVRRQFSTAEDGLRNATVGSAADWRLVEETDRLEAEYGLLDQLHTAFAAKEGATSASPAQWRAQESTDSLCGRLLEPDRAEISSASQVFESPLRAVAV
jgi:hypothetical protein